MTTVTERIKLDFRLTFDSPSHFGTGLRRGLIHRTVARDHQEYLIVPGTTIKGVVRERCEQLGSIFDLDVFEPHDTQEAETRVHEARRGDPDIITRIFGSRFQAGPLFFDDARLADWSETTNDPATSSPPEAAIDRSYFDGYVFDEQKEKDIPAPGKYKQRQVETRTQVSLSRLTRTAKAGQLYTSEYGIRQLCFDGCIYGYLTGFKLSELESGTYSLLLLLAGLLSVDRLGGMKSTGAGQVEIQATQLKIDGQSTPVETILAQLEYLEYYWIERRESL